MAQGPKHLLQAEHSPGKVILCCHLVALKYSLKVERIGHFPGNSCEVTHEDVKEEQWEPRRVSTDSILYQWALFPFLECPGVPEKSLEGWQELWKVDGRSWMISHLSEPMCVRFWPPCSPPVSPRAWCVGNVAGSGASHPPGNSGVPLEK